MELSPSKLVLRLKVSFSFTSINTHHSQLVLCDSQEIIWREQNSSDVLLKYVKNLMVEDKSVQAILNVYNYEVVSVPVLGFKT